MNSIKGGQLEVFLILISRYFVYFCRKITFKI